MVKRKHKRALPDKSASLDFRSSKFMMMNYI